MQIFLENYFSSLKDFDKVLSLGLIKEQEQLDNELLNYINEQIELRRIAKMNKDYQKADEIRQNLLEKNIVIKDTREGTTFEVIK